VSVRIAVPFDIHDDLEALRAALRIES